jgi:chemotaxis protein histidine kinase CheA
VQPVARRRVDAKGCSKRHSRESVRELVGLSAYVPENDIDLEQVVVIDLGDRRAGLVIDELTGQEEIVVKQYDAVRDGLPIFGGATLLSDGRPSLIVDVSSLL